MYCSDECAKQDDVHEKNCPYEIPLNVQILLLKKVIEIDGDFDSEEGLSDDKKKTVFDFDLSNPDDSMYRKNLQIAVNSLSATVESDMKMLSSAQICSNSTEEELQTEMPYKYMRVWATNAYDLWENVRVITGPGTYKYRFYEHFGKGIFPFVSLLNHSCYPNACTLTVDNKCVLTTCRPIKAGEQIFVSYGFSSFRYTREERRQKLARYKFNCDCTACIEDHPKLEKLPKIDRRYFKEPVFGIYSTQAAIKQFKMNCKYIEKNIKDHPTYEVMQLILHNFHLLHAAAKIYFDDIGIEYL